MDERIFDSIDRWKGEGDEGFLDVFYDLYMADSTYCRERLKGVDKSQILSEARRFFEAARGALVYMRDEYGAAAVPVGLRFYQDSFPGDDDSSRMALDAVDRKIHITAGFVADSIINSLSSDGKLVDLIYIGRSVAEKKFRKLIPLERFDHKFRVEPLDEITLLFVEESWHQYYLNTYQPEVLKTPSREDEIETSVKFIQKKAIADLRIPVYYFENNTCKLLTSVDLLN